MRKFKIPKPESTTNKTIRFPNSVIDAGRGGDSWNRMYVFRLCDRSYPVALENLLEEETSKEE